MNVEIVLARLQRVRGNSNGWTALCPAHGDHSPSLSIREGEGGRILLHCFAGCTTESICDGMGIQLRDLFSEPGAVRRPDPQVVRCAQRHLAGLSGRLTPAEREREVVVVLTDDGNLDIAMARALALAVEGELVQVVLAEASR